MSSGDHDEEVDEVGFEKYLLQFLLEFRVHCVFLPGPYTFREISVGSTLLLLWLLGSPLIFYMVPIEYLKRYTSL